MAIVGPSSVPELIIKPSTYCGLSVHLFAVGYNRKSGTVASPILTVWKVWGKETNTPKPTDICKPNHPTACGVVTSPLGNGRVLVRATEPSMSRSRMSFNVQPAPRIVYEPSVSRVTVVKVERSGGGVESVERERNKEVNVGVNKRYVPIGRARRERL